MPIQLDFILRRLAEMVRGQPELAAEQPWKAVAERDHGWFGARWTSTTPATTPT